jgi:murein DD-endopeptidase MepM/ murein hydrolase activator NlpD
MQRYYGLILLFIMLFIHGAAHAGLELRGDAIQGALLQGLVPPGTRVEIDGSPVRVSDDGVFLLGFGRDHEARATLKLVFPDGRTEARTLDVKPRKYQIQRIDGLPKRKVVPKEQDLERIRNESRMIREARARDDARTDFLSGWIWPSEGRISGVYGSQRILNGKPRRPHFGVDIAAPVGTAVKAPADGIVTLAHPDMFFSGGTLIIDHGHRLSSSFLHLEKILVKPGQIVKRGDLIAEVGATGRVTGPHLDWRMNYQAHRLDPQLLVPPMPKPADK